MQLKVARLCLDCDEVHTSSHCPVCASEAFAYLTRWIPAPERRMRPRQTTSPEADLYRQLNATLNHRLPERRSGNEAHWELAFLQPPAGSGERREAAPRPPLTSIRSMSLVTLKGPDASPL